MRASPHFLFPSFLAIAAIAWVDGREVIDSDIVYRTVPVIGVAGLFFSIFFDGSDAA